MFEKMMDSFLYEARQDDDIVTVAGIKVQTGTKEKLDRFLGDFGILESPPIDELLVLLTVASGDIPYDQGDKFDELVYRVDTSEWRLSVEQGDFGNRMLVADFFCTELSSLRDHYINTIGLDDDLLDTGEGDIEFEIVLCADVGEEWDEKELRDLQLNFSSYIPEVVFQEQVVGTMLEGEGLLSVLNGLPIIDSREMG